MGRCKCKMLEEILIRLGVSTQYNDYQPISIDDIAKDFHGYVMHTAKEATYKVLKEMMEDKE